MCSSACFAAQKTRIPSLDQSAGASSTVSSVAYASTTTIRKSNAATLAGMGSILHIVSRRGIAEERAE